jgi:hypothetical protein
VKGRICVDPGSAFWLGRLPGFQIGITGQTDERIDLQCFSDWERTVSDGRRESSVILIGKIGPGLIERLALFAYRVKELRDRLRDLKNSAAFDPPALP